MALMTWRPAFELNIKEVDDQHRKLIELLNILYDSMKQGKGKEVLGQVLTKLADYTVYHFGTEERLFREYGYPESEQHQSEHDAFTRQVIDFQKAYAEGKTLITIELLDFLTNWLTNHILQVDKKFGVYATKKGAA